jgi:hypothetical protein
MGSFSIVSPLHGETFEFQNPGLAKDELGSAFPLGRRKEGGTRVGTGQISGFRAMIPSPIVTVTRISQYLSF